MATCILERPWFKGIALALVLSFLWQPAFAQPFAEEDPCEQARMDGERDANKTLWFIAGCLGGLIGVIIAYAVEPSPPAVALLGKSPDYVAIYTDCYRREVKGIRTRMAWTGCATYAAVSTLVYVLALVAASE